MNKGHPSENDLTKLELKLKGVAETIALGKKCLPSEYGSVKSRYGDDLKS